MDTIFALSSAAGRGGVAVIRCSGPSAWDVAKVLLQNDKVTLKPRYATLSKLIHPVSRETIDQALILPFEAPHSFTGEDVIEFHIHGGRAVIDGVLSALGDQKNCRLAEPGEFTRRAFENGKLDLTEAEAVADLIDAQTAAQRVQALGQLDGNLSKLYQGWSDSLAETLAHLEAEIEFPDEDLPVDLAATFHPAITRLGEEIAAHLNDNGRGERLRDGIQIAIIGAPNAGKSSLVNTLAQRDIAIVSDMAGTTRDVIEAHLDLGGYSVILADTAGLRPEQIGSNAHDKIEAEGIKRALKCGEDADLKILLFDAAEEPDANTMALADDMALIVYNKNDVSTAPQNTLSISTKTGDGIEALLKALTEKIETLYGLSEQPSLTRQRHRAALEASAISLMRAQNAALPEMMAEDLRLALRALGSITGKVDVEDLLDTIFNDFCIGK